MLATDALLDRVGARAPTPDDLDDPVVAALALMAAEIDLDAVPVEDDPGRARVRPEPAVGLARSLAHDERTGLVIDLRQARRGDDARDESDVDVLGSDSCTRTAGREPERRARPRRWTPTSSHRQPWDRAVRW